MLSKALVFISSNGFKNIFAAVASDPSPGNSWRELYNNIFIRFLFIFIFSYQSTSNIKQSILITIFTMSFFYIISTKKEKEQVRTNNFRKKDLKFFCYFVIFVSILHISKLL
jgi:hypothetical protein